MLSSMNIVLLVLVVLVLFQLYKQNQENFDDPNAAYAYQYNIQPFWLSDQSVQLWMKPGLELCKKRVAAECASEDDVSRIGCVQAKLKDCLIRNQHYISRKCKESIPSTICSKHCENSFSNECQQCFNYVQRFDVCKKPDL